MSDHRERLRRNDQSRTTAEAHRELRSDEELEWLRAWEPGDEQLLAELAEMLGRTIEACRQRYYMDRRGWTRTTSVTITRTESYRGWTEERGDGW